eukprot:TRINITY_DN16816_c0_g1_i2.p2 TRINITY_DN16816_c0_g1~~TRINITY_DN16816_c0_g1_i2.p2  ORF type:complete len:136 (+),score=23.99 TRINITY_DN16816_c0_g1_i2:37-408(+)
MAPSCAESVGSQSQRRASRSSSSSLFQRLKEKLGKGGGGGGGGSGLSRAPSVHRSEMSAASPPMSPSSAVAVASPANRTLPQMTLMQGDASQQRHDRVCAFLRCLATPMGLGLGIPTPSVAAW